MKLALGTAQFGLDYGVANISGQTSLREVERIIHRARLAGIDMLDTAAAYGSSEQVLGEIGLNGWKVVSKVPPMPKGTSDGKQWVLAFVKQSLSRLRVARLEGLLLHSPADLLTVQGSGLARGLQDIQAEGLVGQIGFSIYSPQDLPDLLQVLRPNLVQAPFSVFDQRLLKSGWLDRLTDAGVEIHARSVFLQGLLLMTRERRPAFFDRWNELWQNWDALIEAHGGNALAVCIGFVRAQSGIARIVLGIDNLVHLEQVLTTWHDSVPVRGAVELSCDDLELVEPFRWKIA
jgi:aryl-alcohol dehydrogenase-like predicted oxidoreductase